MIFDSGVMVNPRHIAAIEKNGCAGYLVHLTGGGSMALSIDKETAIKLGKLVMHAAGFSPHNDDEKK